MRPLWLVAGPAPGRGAGAARGAGPDEPRRGGPAGGRDRGPLAAQGPPPTPSGPPGHPADASLGAGVRSRLAPAAGTAPAASAPGRAVARLSGAGRLARLRHPTPSPLARPRPAITRPPRRTVALAPGPAAPATGVRHRPRWSWTATRIGVLAAPVARAVVRAPRSGGAWLPDDRRRPPPSPRPTASPTRRPPRSGPIPVRRCRGGPSPIPGRWRHRTTVARGRPPGPRSPVPPPAAPARSPRTRPPPTPTRHRRIAPRRWSRPRRPGSMRSTKSTRTRGRPRSTRPPRRPPPRPALGPQPAHPEAGPARPDHGGTAWPRPAAGAAGTDGAQPVEARPRRHRDWPVTAGPAPTPSLLFHLWDRWPHSGNRVSGTESDRPDGANRSRPAGPPEPSGGPLRQHRIGPERPLGCPDSTGRERVRGSCG